VSYQHGLAEQILESQEEVSEVVEARNQRVKDRQAKEESESEPLPLRLRSLVAPTAEASIANVHDAEHLSRGAPL
jgi:hypothetical protein